MLAYTLYAADEAGRVTTWDLKGLLLELVHTCAHSQLFYSNLSSKRLTASNASKVNVLQHFETPCLRYSKPVP